MKRELFVLLALGLVAVPILSGCGGKLNPKDAAAIAEIRRVGGLIATNETPADEQQTGPGKQAVVLSKTAVTDAALDRIARLTHLTTLILEETNITDAGLAHLRALQFRRLRPAL